MDGNRLINTIRRIVKNETGNLTDLVYGKVISTSPLQIQVDNRFVVGSEFLILSALCKDKTIIVNTNGVDSIIEVWRGLEINDRVRMLKVQSGQLFYVLEREEA